MTPPVTPSIHETRAGSLRAGWPTSLGTLLLAFVVGASSALATGFGDGDGGRWSEGQGPTRPQRLEPGQAPVIDGVLDEEMWQHATRLGPLTQVVPDEGAAPSQRTEVLLTFDAGSFYIGIRCFDDDVSSLRATQRRRDADLDPDDSIELLFDPFLDRRSAFWFQIGPGGARGDALIVQNGRQFNKRWDGIWQGSSTITDEGWFAELAIPFATLNFRADQGLWGFNFRRLIRRRDEEARWASPDRDVRFFSVADAGEIAGLTGLQRGLGLDITPFVVGDWTSLPDEGSDLDTDLGLDVFWQPTSDTKVSLSYNTNFAQTEVDQTQVNLTRFGLFFPEKRDFFLEDSGNFYFEAPSGVVPFFSRRIGLVDGEVVPLTAALKYTGQTKNSTFGVLDALTKSTTLDSDGVEVPLDGQNLFAGRYSHHLGPDASAGLIVTSGDPSGADTGAATLGFDWTWRTGGSRGDNLRVSASALAATNDPDGEEDGLPTAFAASVDAPNDELNWSAGVSYIGPQFDPALGFVRRNGVRRYSAELEYEPRFDNTPWLRQLLFGIEPTLYTDTTGRFESLNVETTLIGARFDSGDRLSLDLLHDVEQLDDSFDVLDQFEVEAGRYATTRAGVVLRFAERREVSGRLTVFGGEFWDGTRTDYEGRVNWRPGPLLSFEAAYERNALELEAGSFDVHVARLRTLLTFTPNLSWAGDLQWDNVSDEVGLNSRLWWILGPGRELFFVVNQGWDASGTSLTTTGTNVAIKLGYTLRY